MRRDAKRMDPRAGFTLVEVIAVLVILGILAAIAIPRYIDLQANAESRAIDAGIAELNGRESLTWGNTKLSTNGWVNDATTFALVDTDLGSNYTWSAAASTNGGTLVFGSASAALTRTPSETASPGRWER